MNIKIKTVSIYETYERNNIKLFNIMKGQQTTTIDKFYIHQYTSLSYISGKIERMRENNDGGTGVQ